MMQTSLARKLRLLRAERGMSLRDAAQASGVTKETLSALERGVREPHDPTLAKIARGYGVPIEDLLIEDETTLAGKGDASETGLSGRLEQLAGEPEEEIIPVSSTTLEWHIRFIKRLKEQREREIEEVKGGATPRFAWIFHMEADDKYLEIIYQASGVSVFVGEVTAGRWMTDFPTQQLCHELSRRHSDFTQLTDEARVLDRQTHSDTYEEAVKGTSAIERYLQDEMQEQRDRNV